MSRRERAQEQPDESLGLEARVTADDHLSLRLWLRLLSLSQEIEIEIKRRLREQYSITLARFDYLAQLHRHPEGLRMSAISRFLMVTGGNVTSLTDELERAGWVQRELESEDRRSWRVRLTPAGVTKFESMAAAHETWVVELFSALNMQDRQQLLGMLGKLRLGFARQQDDGDTTAGPAAKDSLKGTSKSTSRSASRTTAARAAPRAHPPKTTPRREA